MSMPHICRCGICQQTMEALPFVESEVLGTLKALQDVADERGRQINAEGWSRAHDDAHEPGTLSQAAAVYAQSAVRELAPDFCGPHMCAALARRFKWPWSIHWWKPKGPRRDLVRAAALIIAEIERIDRASQSSKAVKP